MDAADPIDTYLHELKRQLRVRRRARRRILAEVRAHLLDAAEAEQSRPAEESVRCATCGCSFRPCRRDRASVQLSCWPPQCGAAAGAGALDRCGCSDLDGDCDGVGVRSRPSPSPRQAPCRLAGGAGTSAHRRFSRRKHVTTLRASPLPRASRKRAAGGAGPANPDERRSQSSARTVASRSMLPTS